jgi:hypothetical protein
MQPSSGSSLMLTPALGPPWGRSSLTMSRDVDVALIGCPAHEGQGNFFVFLLVMFSGEGPVPDLQLYSPDSAVHLGHSCETEPRWERWTLPGEGVRSSSCRRGHLQPLFFSRAPLHPHELRERRKTLLTKRRESHQDPTDQRETDQTTTIQLTTSTTTDHSTAARITTIEARVGRETRR